MPENLSFTGRRWLLSPTENAGTSTLVQRLHAERKLESDGSFLDITVFRDFKKAHTLIKNAIAKKHTIAIFGDYDCDGITGVAQMARYFHRRGVQPIMRLPHRSKEGYGLKREQIEELAEQGAKLIITVDTGISCVDAIETAHDRGIATIIVDHHRIPAIPAKADAVLHPGVDLPEMDSAPSASGMCFAFVSGLEIEDGIDVWEGWEEDLLLSTLGTIADLVPLRGVNRALVRAGLSALPDVKGPLELFAKSARVGKGATSRDLAFRMAPRINAAGRMDDPMIALKGILGDMDALQQLTTLNEARQELVHTLMDDVVTRIDPLCPLLAAIDTEYTPGVVGLLAGKLTELHGRPSIVAHISGELCTASLRSTPAYDITAGLTRISSLLVSFGGHAQAAGCTFRNSDWGALCNALAADIEAHVSPQDMQPSLHIDAVLDASHVTQELCTALSALEPYGQGNLEPRFMIANAKLSDLRLCGAENTHLQVRVNGLKGIAFRLGHIAPSLSLEGAFDVACRLSIHEWNGKKEVQLVIEDMRAAIPSFEPVVI